MMVNGILIDVGALDVYSSLDIIRKEVHDKPWLLCKGLTKNARAGLLTTPAWLLNAATGSPGPKMQAKLPLIPLPPLTCTLSAQVRLADTMRLTGLADADNAELLALRAQVGPQPASSRLYCRLWSILKSLWCTFQWTQDDTVHNTPS